MKSWPKVKLGHVIICSNLVVSTLIWPQNIISVHISPYLPLFTTIYLYLALLPLYGHINYPNLTICAIFTLHLYSSIETAPLCKMLEQSDNYSWRYCISKTWGLQNVSSRMLFGCLSSLILTTFVICSFRYFTSLSNFKAIRQLLMEILHIKDLGDTECRLAAKTVVLVLGEYQISIVTPTSGGYLSSYKI